jgi:hypothetical protein
MTCVICVLVYRNTTTVIYCLLFLYELVDLLISSDVTVPLFVYCYRLLVCMLSVQTLSMHFLWITANTLLLISRNIHLVDFFGTHLHNLYIVDHDNE